MIRTIEELSLGAWPALQTVFYDGWILRFADGYTRRSNSINPIYRGALDVQGKIVFCEKLYRDRGQRVIFKMTSASEPNELDDILAQRGYSAEAQTSVMNLALPVGAFKASLRVKLWDHSDELWASGFADLNSVASNHRRALERIVGSIGLPMRCAAVLDGDKIVSCGMAVVQGPWVGLFDIVTHPDCRRQNLATSVIESLLAWSISAGATRAYLQVMLDNTPALTLYRKLGFVESYQYCYRVKP